MTDAPAAVTTLDLKDPVAVVNGEPISKAQLEEAFKVAVEAATTPLTYWVVNFLKRVENEDYYDRDTNFNPFSG